MIGSRTPVAANISSIATSAALALSVSKIVSSSSTSQPPSMSPRTCSAIRLAHLVERHRPEGRVVHVRRDRQRPVRGAEGTGDEARPIGRARRPGVGRFAREARGGHVEVVHDRLETVVGLGDRRRVEGVGLDQVAARLEVGLVDAADHVRPREHQHVVVAAEVVRRGHGTARRGSRPPSADGAGSWCPSPRRAGGCGARTGLRGVRSSSSGPSVSSVGLVGEGRHDVEVGFAAFAGADVALLDLEPVATELRAQPRAGGSPGGRDRSRGSPP